MYGAEFVWFTIQTPLLVSPGPFYIYRDNMWSIHNTQHPESNWNPYVTILLVNVLQWRSLNRSYCNWLECCRFASSSMVRRGGKFLVKLFMPCKMMSKVVQDFGLGPFCKHSSWDWWINLSWLKKSSVICANIATLCSWLWPWFVLFWVCS